MALLFCDSPDHYIPSDGSKKWSALNNCSLSNTYEGATIFPGGGGSSGVGAQVWRTQSSGTGVQWNSASNDATVVVGGWFYIIVSNALPNATGNIFMTGGDGASLQWQITRDRGNRVVVVNGSSGTTLATSTQVLYPNTWYHIEAKVTTNNTTGVFEVRVNGVTWIAQTTGQNTRNTANNYTNRYYFLYIANNSGDTSGRGFYILNTSGSTANDFIGVNMIRCLRPIAPGNYSQWSPSGSVLSASAVDDTFADGDLSYASSTTASQIDTFVFQDLPSTGSVAAIQHVYESRQDAGTTRQVASIQRSSSTDYVGTTNNQTTSYVFYREPVSTNPATSAAWTTSDVNGAEFGYKLIS